MNNFEKKKIKKDVRKLLPASKTIQWIQEALHVAEFRRSLSPLQSYHRPPLSWDIWSWVRRRWHSLSLVWKNRTGSFRTLHHSQLVSSDDLRRTFSSTSTSWPAHSHFSKWLTCWLLRAGGGPATSYTEGVGAHLISQFGLLFGWNQNPHLLRV